MADLTRATKYLELKVQNNSQDSRKQKDKDKEQWYMVVSVALTSARP